MCSPCSSTTLRSFSLRLMDFKDGWPSTAVLFFFLKTQPWLTSNPLKFLCKILPEIELASSQQPRLNPLLVIAKRALPITKILGRDGFVLALPCLPVPYLKPLTCSGRSCVSPSHLSSAHKCHCTHSMHAGSTSWVGGGEEASKPHSPKYSSGTVAAGPKPHK